MVIPKPDSRIDENVSEISTRNGDPLNFLIINNEKILLKKTFYIVWFMTLSIFNEICH